MMATSRVSIRRCADYDEGTVRDAFHLSLGDLGGMGAFIKRGEKVILKVNLLRGAPPEQGVTTHPAVVLALARVVESIGGVPVVADSPSGTFSEARLRKIYDVTGLLALEKKGELGLNWDLSFTRVPNTAGKVLKSVDILKAVGDADAVITVPKLKTHNLTGITGATKILYGIIPGLAKAGYHAKMPEPSRFCDMLLDLVILVKPRLAVLDGVLGMEGDGPSAGDQRRGNVLMASPDSFALDIAMAAFMGAEPEDVPILRAAIARGLAPATISGVELRGDRLDSVRTGPWKMPSTRVGFLDRMSAGLPPRVMRRMGSLLVRRPVPDRRLCNACGECARNCPQNCIRIINDVVKIDYAKCQSCFCCSETCPDRAMKVREPLFRM